MYNPYDPNFKPTRYNFNTGEKLEELAPEVKEARLEKSRKRFFINTVNAMSETKHLTDTQDIAVWLWVYQSLHGIPNLPVYMPQLIEEAAGRVYKYRYAPHMLSFSDNEKIMLHRLYEVIK